MCRVATIVLPSVRARPRSRAAAVAGVRRPRGSGSPLIAAARRCYNVVMPDLDLDPPSRLRRIRHSFASLGWRQALHETVTGRRAVRPAEDHAFDERHGTDTAGSVEPDHLGIADDVDPGAGDPLPPVAAAGDQLDARQRRGRPGVAHVRRPRLRQGTRAARRRPAALPAGGRDRGVRAARRRRRRQRRALRRPAAATGRHRRRHGRRDDGRPPRDRPADPRLPPVRHADPRRRARPPATRPSRRRRAG